MKIYLVSSVSTSARKSLMELRVQERAGWPILPWCEAVGFSRAFLYTLPPDLTPRSVKVGRRRLITEQPIDWLRRMSDAGAER